MMDLFQANLLRLKASHPAAFDFLAHETDLRPAAALPPGDPQTLAGINLDALRSTTLVYLGADRPLVEVATRLNGQFNLILVEPEPANLLALLAELDHPHLFRPDLILYLPHPRLVSRRELAGFVLHGPALVEKPGLPPTPLGLQVFREIKAVYDRFNQAKAGNPEAYLTMVTYNRLALTRLTLDRLKLCAETPFRLVIVDNDSRDGTREWLAESRGEYPFLDRVLRLDANYGIGRALNNGILYSMSRSSRVGRIDNDMLVPPFWLRDLLTVLESDLRPAIVSGLVNDDPTIRRQLANVQERTCVVNGLKVYLVYVVGGNLNLYRPDVFFTLGLFPEDSLYGFEDGALCRAAIGAGEKIAIVDNVKLEHLSNLLPDPQAYEAFKREQVRTGLARQAETRTDLDEVLRNKV